MKEIEAKAWKILHDYIQPPKGKDTALEIENWKTGLGMAAAEIAKMVEAEIAKSDAVCAGLIADLRVLKGGLDRSDAHVAQMRKAIIRTRGYLAPTGLNDKTVAWLRDAVMELDKALAAAPELLWSGEAKASWRTSHPFTGSPSEILDVSLGSVWIKFFEPRTAGVTKEMVEDGQQVKVLVVKEGDET